MSASVDAPNGERTHARSDAEPLGPCVVVGYDRGDGSQVAVGWAARALPDDGTLVIVHACRPLHAPPPPFTSTTQRRRRGGVLIDELLLEVEDAVLDVPMRIEIVDEDPVSALTNASARHAGCPIVVGAEPHSRLHRALGTVTSELLARSHTPIVVVPARHG